MTPTWLTRTRGETTRAVALRTCPRCRAATLTGLDADHAGLPARVDPTPLTRTGEAIALLAGRRTYELHKTAGRAELDYRYAARISSKQRGTVLATHECGNPITQYAEPQTDKPKPEQEKGIPF